MNYEKFRANLKRRAIQQGVAEEIARNVVEGNPAFELAKEEVISKLGEEGYDPQQFEEMKARAEAAVAQAVLDYLQVYENAPYNIPV